MTPKELKELRENNLDMTQKELADALDVEFATVNRWENNKTKIPEDKQKLLECIQELVDKSLIPKAKFTLEEIKDAIINTGVWGLVLAALTAGILSSGLVLSLMKKSALMRGVVGLGGLNKLPYFKKIRKEKNNER